MSRVIGHVVGRNYLDGDGVRRAPMVAVVMHDDEPPVWIKHVFRNHTSLEPLEIIEARAVLEVARASLPDTPCTDWFGVEAGR